MLGSAPKINFQSFAQSMSAVGSLGGVDAVVSEEKKSIIVRDPEMKITVEKEGE